MKEQTRRFVSRVMLILAIVFVLFGSITLYIAYEFYTWAESSRDWPTTEGVVTKSDFCSEVRAARNFPYRSETYYWADIQYDYTVNGLRYISGDIGVSTAKTNVRTDVQEVLDRFPVGRRITVYYDPFNPDDTLLEPGADTGNYVVFFVGGLFYLAGLVVTYIRSRIHNRQSDDDDPAIEPYQPYEEQKEE